MTVPTNPYADPWSTGPRNPWMTAPTNPSVESSSTEWPVTVITVRGTGERHNSGDNLLAFVTDQLDRTRFRAVDLAYPASVGIANPDRSLAGVSADRSVQLGVRALAAEIVCAPYRVVLVGYSLGALVVTRFLEAQARGDYADCHVYAAANVANPLRAPGCSLGETTWLPGFGIQGRHHPLSVESRDPWAYVEVANPLDGICCCPEDSPLRFASDGLSAFSFVVGGGWSADLADRVLRRRWQPFSIDWWRNPKRVAETHFEAAALVHGYLTGQHTRAYVDGGYLDRLAAWIESAVL